FIGQFLPVFLQFGLSAANTVVHMAATRIDNKIFAYFFITLIFIHESDHRQLKLVWQTGSISPKEKVENDSDRCSRSCALDGVCHVLGNSVAAYFGIRAFRCGPSSRLEK